MERLWAAFGHSMDALRHLLRHEAAFRQEAVLFILGVPAAFVITDSLWQFLLLLVVIVLVMIVEALNTALEAVCDAVTEHHDERIKLAKDCGSLAVLMSVAIALGVWMTAFLGWLV